MRKGHGWAVLTIAVVLGLAGCGGGGSGGTETDAGPILGDDAIRAAEVVATTDATRQPVDGAPSPDGAVIYYVATGDGGPVIYSVPATGGAAATIAQGAPLANPSGVAVATDGSRLYIADRQAGASGGILTVPASGAAATPTLLPGTEGRSPRGLDVVKQSGADVVYFTGTGPANGAVGLFQVPAAGGTVVTVAEGAPFASPDAVVVNTKGVAYVTDQGAGAGQGKVFRVGGGAVTPALSDLHLGAPAGVTLVNGDDTLLVSSIDATTRSDQVLFLDIPSGETRAATKVIGANKDSSGGLHRAYAADVLAWADVSRGGRVYRVEL